MCLFLIVLFNGDTRKFYKEFSLKKHMNKSKKLGLAGLLLLGATSVFSPRIDAKPAEDKPAVLDNFDYASHRKGYEGKIFNYDLLSNGTASQTDKKNVNIEPIWFYDIDNDGKFGKAEMDAIKAGIPIFMHQAFNDIANAKVRKFLEIATEYSSLKEKLKDAEKNSGTQKEFYEKRISELEAKLKEYQAQNPVQNTQQAEIPKTENKTANPIYLIFGADSNFAFNSYSGFAGIRINPFKDKKLVWQH